jgi:alpha-L-rhamnosidase
MTNLHSPLCVATLLLCTSLHAQNSFPDGKLDPTRDLTSATQPPHAPLPEEYIWTAGDVTINRPDHNKFPWNRPQLRIDPHFFRTRFTLKTVPASATIYIAGPRSANVYINGKIVASFNSDIDAPIGFHVFHTDVTHYLSTGENTLAIEAVRGRGIVAGGGPRATQQLAYGEVFVAKIIGAPYGATTPVLTYSSTTWKSATTQSPHWSDSNFDDSTWPAANPLGPVESNVDFFQWNGDAGMYEWPGYMGMSPSLRTYSLKPAAISHVFAGAATFSTPDDLTKNGQPFTVTNLGTPTDSEAPSLLLDFGREVTGRVLIESASPCDATVSLAYGESEIEAMSTGLSPGQQGGNYLGTNLLHVPARGIARGPKSAFRYARIRFLRGCPTLTFSAIRLEGIYYPVDYAGSFESSDPLLNRIWETGAYTAHLCMQDGLWDAPKRDRGRWAGDIDVEGRVISTAFGEDKLIEDTLRRLVPEGDGHVNGIPSYSALWITSLANLYERSGDQTFLQSQHNNLIHILSAMDAELNPDGLFTNTHHQWLFVDWAPGLYAYTPDATTGTQLQYVRAYSAAAKLFSALGDTTNASKYEAQMTKALTAARTKLRDQSAPTYGSTWQLNALAILTGEDGDPGKTKDSDAIWSRALSNIKQDTPSDPVISPYFNAYLLDALAKTNHNKQALDWIRQYWGGMLAEGATSFWESYDLRWPKTNPHLSLQADGTSGYFVSLAHGWSAGPTAWLSENVLGISPATPGYKHVTIEPDLMGLDWAQGSVPTPNGPIKIRIDKLKGITLDLPQGVESASVHVEIHDPHSGLLVNGQIPNQVISPTPSKTDRHDTVTLTRPGHYEITTR